MFKNDLLSFPNSVEKYSCRLRRSSQGATNGTNTAITFSNIDYDPYNLCTKVLGLEKTYILIPKTGLYMVSLAAQWQAGGANNRNLYLSAIRSNSLVTFAAQSSEARATSAVALSIHMPIYLQKNDLIHGLLYQDSGAAQSLINSDGEYLSICEL